MVGLSETMVIDLLVINDTTGRPIVFGGADHPAEPCGGLVHFHSLQDPKPHVPIKPSLHLLSPVDGDGGRSVYCDRLDRFINEQLHGGALLHQWERLLLAAVEGAGGVPGEDVVLDDGQVC